MLKILIVEDNAICALNLKIIFEMAGYEILKTESSGKRAITRVIDEKPDLMIMDIILIDEVDGISAVKQIHSQINIPVIYLTASTDKATLERMEESSYCGVIRKPFNSSTVVKEVEQFWENCFS